MKDWKPFYDECTRCGSSDVYVLTDAVEDGYAYDGDDAKCGECELLGNVAIDGEENENGDSSAHIDWNDYEEINED